MSCNSYYNASIKLHLVLLNNYKLKLKYYDLLFNLIIKLIIYFICNI